MTRMYSINFMGLLLSMLVVQKCVHKPSAETMNISGSIIFVDRYCGGAPPSEEMMRQFNTPKPMRNFKMYIKQGTKNELNKKVYAQVATDQNGKFSIQLPAGEYVLLSSDQLTRDIFTPAKDIQIMDKGGLETWWENGLAKLTQSDTINITMKKRCYLPLGIPYLRYTGRIAP